MVAPASMGLELPSSAPVPTGTQAVILYKGAIIHQCTRRGGRLIGPRPLEKELNALLNQCKAVAHKRIAALPPGRAVLAGRLASAHGYWEKLVRKYHMTAHHLRRHDTEAFGCWALPEAVRLQLLRQFAANGHWPQAQRLRLVLISPVTAHLRLLGQVAVYLRGPNTCCRNGRMARGATGQWLPVPPERVHAELCLGMVVVVIE